MDEKKKLFVREFIDLSLFVSLLVIIFWQTILKSEFADEKKYSSRRASSNIFSQIIKTNKRFRLIRFGSCSIKDCHDKGRKV